MECFLAMSLNTTPYEWNGSDRRRNLGLLYEGGYLHRVIDDALFSYALTDKAIKELQDDNE
jgi:hypothetical protein